MCCFPTFIAVSLTSYNRKKSWTGRLPLPISVKLRPWSALWLWLKAVAVEFKDHFIVFCLLNSSLIDIVRTSSLSLTARSYKTWKIMRSYDIGMASSLSSLDIKGILVMSRVETFESDRYKPWTADRIHIALAVGGKAGMKSHHWRSCSRWPHNQGQHWI